MTYFRLTRKSNWYVGGENVSAECLQRDECDYERGYGTLQNVTRDAEDHVRKTGHPVQIERAQFRVVNPGPS